jgi:hypothetical protein
MGNAARNDCGPAVALMLARALGKGNAETVQSLAERFDPPADGTTAADLRAMWAHLGLMATAGDGYPHAALIRYTDLPHRYDPNYTGLHWIVRLDDTHFHDPLWPDSRGANILAPRTSLDAMTRAKLGVSMTTAGDAPYVAREPYDRVVHVPTQTATRAQYDIVAGEAYLRKQSVCFSVDDACLPITGLRSRRIVFWGIAPDQQQAYRDFVSRYYSAPSIPTTLEFRQYAVEPPIVVPPPIVPGKVLIGVNVIGNHRIAFDYAAQGCRYFQVLDNFPVAAQLARQYPDAVVVHRHYVSGPWGGAGLAAHMLAGELHPNCIYETLNESDNGQGYGNAKELNDRLDAELSAAAIVRQRGYRVSLGAYSMGTPDFWNDELADIFRRRVAGLYNNDPGIYIGFHLYTRKIGQDFDVWYARRWAQLFSRCGFDPKLRKVLCSETGVDEGGVGGFPAHGYTGAQFSQWCRDWLACQAQESLGWPTQILGGALFQSGNDNDWAGYRVDQYMPLMQEFWK